MCGGPARSKKSEKNVFFYSFIISKLLCIVFMLDVHVFVKQHELVDLVQYIVLVESIFCFYCITVLKNSFCLQCFDAVGWAAGRASGL